MLKNRQSSNFSEECGLGWGGDREEEDGGEVTLHHHLLLPYPHCGAREKHVRLVSVSGKECHFGGGRGYLTVAPAGG